MIFKQNETKVRTHNSITKTKKKSYIKKKNRKVKRTETNGLFSFLKWIRSSFCITQKTHSHTYGQSCVNQNIFK